MRLPSALLAFVVVLAPSLVRAECDADGVRAVIDGSSAPIARLLRAHSEPEHPERWRASAVTVGEPLIAPILGEGCHGALVEYAWIATDRRAPAITRWRHGLAVLAVRGGRVRLVARRALDGAMDAEPAHHDVSFVAGDEPTIVVTLGSGGGSSGWGSQQRFRLAGRRLIALDALRLGTVAR